MNQKAQFSILTKRLAKKKKKNNETPSLDLALRAGKNVGSVLCKIQHSR